METDEAMKLILYFLRKIFSEKIIISLKRRYKIFFRISFSLNKMDKIIISNNYSMKGYYLEIGGNDGITQSNTYCLSRKGWSGLLVEPNHKNYKLCKYFRPNDKVVNSACVSFDQKKHYIYLSDDDLESSQLHLTEHDEVYIAPANTLNSILIKQGAPKFINFFSLDVEGAELDVLKGLDFDNYSFGLILIEVRNDVNQVRELLEKNGYKFREKFSHHDYLFEKSNYK